MGTIHGKSATSFFVIVLAVSMELASVGAAAAIAPHRDSLVKREGARGIVVLVPRSWTLKIADGDPAAKSTWSNPRDRRQRLVATVSTAIDWLSPDAEIQAIDPSSIIPNVARVARVSLTEFRYSMGARGKHLAREGAWVARFDKGAAVGFQQIDIAAPPPFKRRSRRIIDAFVKKPAAVTTSTRPSSTVPQTNPPTENPNACAQVTPLLARVEGAVNVLQSTTVDLDQLDSEVAALEQAAAALSSPPGSAGAGESSALRQLSANITTYLAHLFPYTEGGAESGWVEPVTSSISNIRQLWCP